MEVSFQTQDGITSGVITMGSIPADGMRFAYGEKIFKVLETKFEDDQYFLKVRQVKPLQNISKAMRVIRP